ncbi:SDR family oxidoreductase [Staphylococcus xylosus]|uniref:SDR family oxidoreductase n=1 Tax=Staphylococcus xylosus TaxID=1288 RepID=UPI000852B9AD|nr:SDR family oxidoreductase [Staphylococcus xylosus]MBG3874277.1 SDR family oxidoreductase [Staphylococcus xylosus]MCA2498789.1 SDR family oxidoreductase [Staphylococcus xylosus]MCA2503911.1 SDR family oxidoreductase [Staphylococcus xylosus]MCE7781093.1 SDR family oxidoreductase [Staphylococcus xylosus]OEK86051.1 short-chain dehydrogenase [Staphylococcus xylosus]
MGKFNSLNDKVVVIAGGAKNMGGLLSKSYAEHGAKLVIHHHDEHSLNEAQETLAKVEALGGQGTLFSGDLTQVKNVESLFQHAQNTFGKIDIAINTVGKVLKKPMAHTTEEEFDNMADINAKSAYFFIKYAEKAMNDNGKIITLATALLAAYTGLYATYAGGKSPVEHYTRAASKEYMGRGISVNAVAPGPMDTPFFYPQESEEAVAFHKSQALHNQLTNIEDIAPIITFLTTDGWWINGQTLFANGGYTTR